MNINILICVAIYLIGSTTGLMLFKMSVTGMEFQSISSYAKLLLNYKFVLGFLLYATSFLTWIVILSRKDLSYIYPIVIGLSYVLVMVLAVIVLKENFTMGKFAGALLIGLGILVMVVQK